MHKALKSRGYIAWFHILALKLEGRAYFACLFETLFFPTPSKKLSRSLSSPHLSICRPDETLRNRASSQFPPKKKRKKKHGSEAPSTAAEGARVEAPKSSHHQRRSHQALEGAQFFPTLSPSYLILSCNRCFLFFFFFYCKSDLFVVWLAKLGNFEGIRVHWPTG